MRADDTNVQLSNAGEGFDDRVYCPVSDHCGGCALIGRHYAIQLEYKRAVVREALAEWSILHQVPVEACMPAPRRTAYRNRAKLAVMSVRGKVRAGLFRRGSREVVDVSGCRVQGETTMASLPHVTQWLGRHRLASPVGPIKFIDLREAAEERCHLTLVLECEPERAPALPLAELTESMPELCGVSVNFNAQASSYVFGRTTRTPWGNRTFLATVPGRNGDNRMFEVPAVGFFQVATAQLPPIHERMASHLGNTGPMLDLYCGVGVHGLSLAAPNGTSRLVGIEENTSAAACARRNADRLGVTARFVAGKVERSLPGLLEELPPRRIVLNPGRAGCRSEVLEALDPAPGRRMVYLSCEPQTLARDLAALVGGGWTVKQVIPVDLMPQTAQVEALALLEPARRRSR